MIIISPGDTIPEGLASSDDPVGIHDEYQQ